MAKPEWWIAAILGEVPATAGDRARYLALSACLIKRDYVDPWSGLKPPGSWPDDAEVRRWRSGRVLPDAG